MYRHKHWRPEFRSLFTLDGHLSPRKKKGKVGGGWDLKAGGRNKSAGKVGGGRDFNAGRKE